MQSRSLAGAGTSPFWGRAYMLQASMINAVNAMSAELEEVGILTTG